MTNLHLMITGATGYIGSRLVLAANRKGHRLTLLVRAPGESGDKPDVRWFPWSLEETPPAEAFAQSGEFGPVDALIHLAHQWTSSRFEPDDENLTGTATLIEAARAAGIPRTVYGSTVSARKDALNRYGRNKWAVEQLFEPPGGVSARIGLVYGGIETGQWGALSEMVSRLPLLPVPGARALVQPIHIDEVCTGLLTLAERPALSKAFYGLAAPDPIAFGQFLKHVARYRFNRKLRIFSVPIWLALIGARLTSILPFVPTVDRERVLGVAGIQTMKTAADLVELEVLPEDLEKNLVALNLSTP